MDAPTPALLILLAAIEAKRDRRGFAWCEKKGIGAYRVALGSPIVVPITAGKSAEVMAFSAARRESAEVLQAICRVCGGCKLAKV